MPAASVPAAAREAYKYFPSSLSPVTPSESPPRPRRPLPTRQQPQPSQKPGGIREDEGAVVSSVVKMPPEAAAMPEPLSDEDLPLAPARDQDRSPWSWTLRCEEGGESEACEAPVRKSEKKEERDISGIGRSADKWQAPEQAHVKEPAPPPQHLGLAVRAARPPPRTAQICGLKLAANRICQTLPQRIQQWQQSPCTAEEQGKKLLERIRREQQSARTAFREWSAGSMSLRPSLRRPGGRLRR
ncbi:hypothetical protein QTO34_013171 [Cnephaeus nilssonii]|uniref:CXXC-type zinc finger protein 1 n=1 Tax=Cnephaeus nilssonii TaxID=3371016 RepID=A0AA40LUW7_CNENI|nr:hypothetical protein QTO34_013171 [Eptesicus nilssonii]